MDNRHPDLFRGYCLTFRQNIILAIADIGLQYKETYQFISTDRFCEMMNQGAEAEEG